MHRNAIRRTTRNRLTAGLAALALLGAACGESEPNTAADPTTTGSAGTVEVAIDTFMFDPDPVQVKVGDTITWTNNDSILHTVTSGDREYDPNDSGRVTSTNKDGRFDEKLDGKGSTASVTFDEAGTVHYFCDRHPGMEADIEVS